MERGRTAKRLHKSDTQTERKNGDDATKTTPTLSNSTFSDQRFAAGHESSPKSDNSLFRVVKGSDIHPYELADAGFEMQDFKFFPADFAEVRKRLCDFLVTDESTAHDKVYRFERLPF